MNNLKNLAGNDVSIFLFRFEILSNGIRFVINEAIGQDMYQDLDEKIKPLAHACCETLARYRHLSVGPTIMDGNLLDSGEFEVMLSRGLGRYFPEDEKQQLFQDTKKIADLLIEVMERSTKEEKERKKYIPYVMPHLQNPQTIKRGLEKLGHAKRLQAELQWIAEGQQVRPGLRRLRPEDLPSGVTASRGYDHRGQCINFEHKTLGELGRIIMIKASDGQMLMQAEICKGQEGLDSPLVKRKKKVFKQVFKTISDCFDENFPA